MDQPIAWALLFTMAFVATGLLADKVRGRPTKPIVLIVAGLASVPAVFLVWFLREEVGLPQLLLVALVAGMIAVAMLGSRLPSRGPD